MEGEYVSLYEGNINGIQRKKQACLCSMVKTDPSQEDRLVPQRE